VGTGPGCAPVTSSPSSKTEAILKRANEIAEFFNDDGSYNVGHKKIEEYALCLYFDNKKEEALTLFKPIVGESTDILLKPDRKAEGFRMIANTPGKLGCESFYVFAHLLKEFGHEKRAGLYFRQIVDADIKNSGIRGGDILEGAAWQVLELRTYPFGMRRFYSNLYKKAASESY
jgi:hypothetical protein